MRIGVLIIEQDRVRVEDLRHRIHRVSLPSVHVQVILAVGHSIGLDSVEKFFSDFDEWIIILNDHRQQMQKRSVSSSLAGTFIQVGDRDPHLEAHTREDISVDAFIRRVQPHLGRSSHVFVQTSRRARNRRSKEGVELSFDRLTIVNGRLTRKHNWDLFFSFLEHLASPEPVSRSRGSSIPPESVDEAVAS